jgi:hypothetical protein
MAKEKCCYTGSDAHDGPHDGTCPDEAEFRIIDLDDPRPDVGETFACEAHVGPLLGHAEGWGGRAGTGWQVVALNPL